MNKEFFDALNAFEPRQHEGISIAQLLAYCVNFLRQNNIPTTFETLVVTAFKLFPESFSLVGFPGYPDAARVNRALLQARPKYQNLILGDVHKGYRLTQKGEYNLSRTMDRLNMKTQAEQSKKASKERTFAGSVAISKIEGSEMFKAWKASNLDGIGQYDIWIFLEAAPYTEKRIIREIINDYRTAAEVAKRKDILDFLQWLRSKYPEILK